MDGWIKLHRKLLNNSLLRDHTALSIFISLLLMVDRGTGKKNIGRIWMSSQLGLHDSTFYKALKRLEKNYKMVTLSSNNKYTEVQIVNWLRYQSSEEVGNSSGNNKVTTKEQQSNTLQEVKNKELRILPKGNMVKDQYGNKYVEYVLEAFKKNVGAYPIEENRRNIAHNIVQITGTFIKKHGDKYLTSRGTAPTFTSLIDKSWIIYNKNNEGTTTRRLKTFKQHYKFMLEKLESELSTL